MKKIKSKDIVEISQKPFPEITSWLDNILKEKGGYASLVYLEDKQVYHIKFFNKELNVSGGFSEVHGPRRISIMLAGVFSAFESPFKVFPELAKQLSFFK